jgi:hypothetical protein
LAALQHQETKAARDRTTPLSEGTVVSCSCIIAEEAPAMMQEHEIDIR